jgi:hypothetical protein
VLISPILTLETGENDFPVKALNITDDYLTGSLKSPVKGFI